jgi:hypothetical protein
MVGLGAIGPLRTYVLVVLAGSVDLGSWFCFVLASIVWNLFLRWLRSPSGGAGVYLVQLLSRSSQSIYNLKTGYTRKVSGQGLHFAMVMGRSANACECNL